MNYELINDFKAQKEKIFKSKKKNLTRKDIGTLGMRPTEKRTITIQVKLPTWTQNDNDYIPAEFLKKYYKKGTDEYGYTYYIVKKNKQEEASKIRIPLEVKQYFYDKEAVLNRLDEVIEGYQEALAHTCENVERNIKELQAKLARYKELLK